METINPKDLGLIELMQRFPDERKAREFLEAIRWPDGPVCIHCGNADGKRIYKVTPNPAKKIREGIYRCGECAKDFTVTLGSVFESSKIPLNKWLLAWYLV